MYVRGCARQVRQVATMDDPARAKALKEREEEERIRERETLERKQARARPACASWHCWPRATVLCADEGACPTPDQEQT